MSLSLVCARATIKKVKADKKAAGESLVSTLRIELKTSADLLAEFHPTLRAALFVKGAGVRFPSMKEIGWEGTRRNVDLGVRPAPDMKAAFVLGGITLRDFRFTPVEEAQQQQVVVRFAADLPETTSITVSRLLDYLKEEAWIDINGGGELDLAPPSVRTDIPELDDTQPQGSPGASAPPPASVAAPKDVDAVRRLQPSRKSVKQKLVTYPDQVLTAAIAAENAAANCRPMFISMIQAELDRRHQEKS